MDDMQIMLDYMKNYDLLCFELDSLFKLKNYCDFKDGRCIASRVLNSANLMKIQNHCCYLKNYDLNSQCNFYTINGCTIKSLSCKISKCEYLNNQGVDQEVFEILDKYDFFKLPLKCQAKFKSFLFLDKTEVIKLLKEI